MPWKHSSVRTRLLKRLCGLSVVLVILRGKGRGGVYVIENVIKRKLDRFMEAVKLVLENLMLMDRNLD
jgi:hypothetical protein